MIRYDENNNVIDEEVSKAILVGLELSEDITYSMDELQGLASASNVECLGQVIQKLEKPNTATFIGSGKVSELKELASNMGADLVIFNDELSGMQLRNLEDILGIKVIDRTILILDIFASRAVSKEGKLQVEYAQLEYRLPRLTGFGRSLSRLGGGIGTRGPGEKKLETDRRHIEHRMDDIKKELASIKKDRQNQRKKREKNEIPVVALVGYTNAGKSALMNKILELSNGQDKNVYEENMLFATLDTSDRRISLEDNHDFILVDTVGFVSKLPHQLVESFKATLEEVKYADLLIHVVDSSYDNHDFQIEVTNKVLQEIGAGEKDSILCFNKVDIKDVEISPKDSFLISAKTGLNVDGLLEEIKKRIFKNEVRTTLIVPYERGDISSYLHTNSNILKTEYVDSGTKFEVILKESDYNRLKQYEAI